MSREPMLHDLRDVFALSIVNALIARIPIAYKIDPDMVTSLGSASYEIADALLLAKDE